LTFRSPFKETLQFFSQAINTQSHLNKLISLAEIGRVEVNETILEIEENIRWMAVKIPEIEMWVNAGTKVKLSVATILALIVATIFY
jgi:hypothetical protein